jgi:hypothetical protein
LRVELREREIEHGDVISGGVRAGVPRAEHSREPLARVVQVTQQRVVAIAALEVPVRLFLL